MNDIRRQTRRRMREITLHLRLLMFVEQSGKVMGGTPRHPVALKVAPDMIHVLKAGVFVHLYNLVESVIRQCLAIPAMHIRTTPVSYADLVDGWQQAWIRAVGKLGDEKVNNLTLEAVSRVCESILDANSPQIIAPMGAGNLDDRRVEEIAKKYGVQLTLRPSVLQTVKRQVHNDAGFLGLVKQRRNDLAHGDVSFGDIGQDYTSKDLATWAWATYQYLKNVISCFEQYMASSGFRRPSPADADA